MLCGAYPLRPLLSLLRETVHSYVSTTALWWTRRESSPNSAMRRRTLSGVCWVVT